MFSLANKLLRLARFHYLTIVPNKGKYLEKLHKNSAFSFSVVEDIAQVDYSCAYLVFACSLPPDEARSGGPFAR